MIQRFHTFNLSGRLACLPIAGFIPAVYLGPLCVTMICDMNKWVLITGASQGIGHEFAKIFAADGWNLVLVARDRQRLAQIASELIKLHQISAKVLAKDLSTPDIALEIFEELQNDEISISVLINNAGFGFQGPFAQIDLPRHVDLIQVNITALVQLTHLFLKPMLHRRQGRILNVASTAAFVPGPFLGTYHASKAFVQSFSHALGTELKGSGVTVTSLCPGFTKSQFHARAGLIRSERFFTMDAGTVARIGYRALMQGRPVVIAGWLNKLAIGLARVVPARWVALRVAKWNR
jgi:short-subunit dehydrogenase